VKTGFVVLALGFGLLFAFAVPPGQIPDEPVHFIHAYHLSEGGVRFGRAPDGERGVQVPREVASFRRRFDPDFFRRGVDKMSPAELRARLGDEPPSDERVFLGSYASYSPLTYAPQVAGIVVARSLGFSVADIFYAGRIAALLFWIACLVSAIHLLPLFRRVYWVIGLLPMSLFLAASYSADVVTGGLALLLVAAVLRLAFDREARFDGRAVAFLAALATALSFTKLVYVPLALLVLAIPAGKAASRREYARGVAFVFGMPLVTSALALAVAPDVFHPMLHSPALPAMPRVPGALVREPLRFAAELLHTTWVECWHYVRMMVGRFGWLDSGLPSWAVWTYFLSLLGLAIVDHPRGLSPSRAQRLLAVSLFVAIYVAIQATAWVRWTRLAEPVIVGFQGRYLLPALPAALLSLPIAGAAPSPRAWRWIHALLIVTSTVGLVAAVATILERYYGLHAALSTVGLQPLVEGGLFAPASP